VITGFNGKTRIRKGLIMKTKFVEDKAFSGCMKCCIEPDSPECHAAECLSIQREDGLNGHFEEVKREASTFVVDKYNKYKILFRNLPEKIRREIHASKDIQYWYKSKWIKVYNMLGSRDGVYRVKPGKE